MYHMPRAGSLSVPTVMWMVPWVPMMHSPNSVRSALNSGQWRLVVMEV